MSQTGQNRKAYKRPTGLLLDPEKVKAVIQREGRTTAWIADRCFVTPGSLRHILGGRRHISAGTFHLFATALNIRDPIEVMATEEPEAS